jgi:outer membrane protein TolC
MRLKIFILIISAAFFTKGFSQSDSTLSLINLYKMVLTNHPVAAQAGITGDMGKALLLSARGNFDPVMQAEYRDKAFDGKNYYNALLGEFKIPTRLGIDFKAAYELNDGARLNPENYTPNQGIVMAGVSVPIGQGLWTDKRRNALRQAKAMAEMNNAEQIQELNDLLLEVATDYYEWYFRFYAFERVDEGYNLALDRLNFVKERIKFGDLAAIDSIEASIEVQQRFIQRMQAGINLVNATLRLSNHIWGENNQPAFLSPDIKPQPLYADSLFISIPNPESLVQSALNNHPKLVFYRAKIKQINAERRYKADLLKPNLRLDYNFLQESMVVNDFNTINPDYRANYKVGLVFKYPLLLRKERGDLKLAKLKLSDAEFELTQQTRELENKIRAASNEFSNMPQLLNAQKELVDNYFILRDGEQERFKNGESSLLIINIRERSLIESQIKYIEQSGKAALAKEKLLWNAGVLSSIQK